MTRGPAFQLQLHNRVGSLDMGLDADFAIWSASPLSAFAVCEATYIDGLERFSLERDRELRAWAEKERNRIVQKILRVGGRKKERDKPAEVTTGDGPGVCGCGEEEGGR